MQDFKVISLDMFQTLFNFDEVLKHYNVQSHEILHIGYSYSDVAVAKRAGIISCWLNRNNVEWNHKIEPDFICTIIVTHSAVINSLLFTLSDGLYGSGITDLHSSCVNLLTNDNGVIEVEYYNKKVH